MRAVTRKRISSFTRAESGSVAINFGLTIIPIIFMVGSAVDYSNAVRARANLQVATDSTALALGQKGMDQSESQLFATAKAFLGAVADDSAASIVSAEKLNMGGNSSKICVTAQTRTETAFMKLAGYEYVTVQSNSCVTSGSANFEIAMVLDTSGSMNNGAGGSSKIAALRTAGQNFVDYMYGPKMNGAGMKISVVPFSWGVAVDPGQYRGASWVDTNGASSLHWAGYTGQTGLATSRFDLFNWMRDHLNEESVRLLCNFDVDGQVGDHDVEEAGTSLTAAPMGAARRQQQRIPHQDHTLSPPDAPCPHAC